MQTTQPPSRPLQSGLDLITEEKAARASRRKRHTLFHVENTRYDYLRTLDKRANGEVLMLAARYEKHGLTGPVVIKRVRSPNTYERRQRLKEEVQLAYRLNHPAIAQVHQWKVHERKPYVVMEYVDGPTLEAVLNLMALRRQPVSRAFALYVAAEVADALHHAHRLTDDAGRPLGLVHRDVSPRNVSLSREGAVKLTNFGVAYTHLAGREETQGALRKGDVAYASPEYLACQPLTPAADIFSLGLVLLELATGYHLFHAALELMPEEEASGEQRKVRVEEQPSLPLTRMLTLMATYTPEDVVRAAATLPEDFQAVLQQALRRGPGARPATAGDMRDALRACLAREQQAAGGGLYGRQEAATELARLITEASASRDVADLDDESLFASDLEAHELGVPPSGGKSRP